MKPEREIINELYRAFVLLGAKMDLLSTIGSWKDSMPDQDVLSSLRAWNSSTLQELRQRIKHSSFKPFAKEEAEK